MKVSMIARSATTVVLSLLVCVFAYAGPPQVEVLNHKLTEKGIVSVIMMDMPSRVVSGSGVYSFGSGLNEQKRAVSPKAGAALLRLGVLLEFPPPGIKITMNSFELRSASGQIFRPFHFFSNFDAEFKGAISQVGFTVGPIEKSLKGVIFGVPKVGIESLELYVEDVSGGKIGEVRDTIRTAQHRLLKLGYKPGPADGVWGPRTSKAIKAFQKSSGLRETGKLYPKTFDRLMKAK